MADDDVSIRHLDLIWGTSFNPTQGNGATRMPIYWYHSKGNWLRYSYAADSYYI